MLTPDSLKHRLLVLGISEDEIHGMTAQEIRRLEKERHVKFPGWYVDFLRIMGRGAGRFLSDVTMFYPSLRSLTDAVRSYLDGIIELPDDAFVLANYSGEVFLFFRSDGNPNPRVYRWSEGTQAIRELGMSFWEYLDQELTEEEARQTHPYKADCRKAKRRATKKK